MEPSWLIPYTVVGMNVYQGKNPTLFWMEAHGGLGSGWIAEFKGVGYRTIMDGSCRLLRGGCRG